MKKIAIYLALTIAGLFLQINTSNAHSGGTDADGCHRNRKTGDFHCHNAREPGAYARQMQGYSKSSRSTWILWLLIPGGIVVAAIAVSDKNDKK